MDREFAGAMTCVYVSRPPPSVQCAHAEPRALDALPDLVLVVKRDGTPIAHAGGRAVPELGNGTAERFAPAWSETTAALMRRLVRNAIADRGPVEARFRERDRV